ncbi:RNA/RNP complex-1-interacting phosphatase [Electrophorus electricus]|uniref:RNA/RNP complex-1-interacting phosphatase n=1 Tax=Electrophorus electricus TaxID=8005 RepID=UPI0015D08A2D|nr:RNA/RNP complex-1-interacting phosphatase [Electrophorus electricus]
MTLRNTLSAASKIMSPKKKSAIPDRWTDYAAVGKRIPGTRFIAFKVPLKQSLRNRLSQSEAFGPFDLLDLLEKEGQELGLVIDLTFTTRYYQPQDLPETLHYLKIFTAGHEVPSDDTILSFKKAVRRFLHENQTNDKLIGVHCTHGLNRTGYLVCRYLIDVDGVEPHRAIDLFNDCRGHAIERQNYLDDLRSGPKRSNVGMEVPDQEPVQGGAKHWKPNPPSSSARRPHPRPGPQPHFPFTRGPRPEHLHYQDHFVSYHQRGVNHQMRFGLLATPPCFPPSQGLWPRGQALQGTRGNQYPAPAPSPYPTLMPRYTIGEPWGGPSSFSLMDQVESREHRTKPRHRRGKTLKKKT